jgi:hypothetical protein
VKDCDAVIDLAVAEALEDLPEHNNMWDHDEGHDTNNLI